MDSITLTICERDYTLILGALRECVGAIEGWELPVRVGGTAAKITATSLKVRAQGEEQGARE
jgi:hypothetical protein